MTVIISATCFKSPSGPRKRTTVIFSYLLPFVCLSHSIIQPGGFRTLSWAPFQGAVRCADGGYGGQVFAGVLKTTGCLVADLGAVAVAHCFSETFSIKNHSQSHNAEMRFLDSVLLTLSVGIIIFIIIRNELP